MTATEGCIDAPHDHVDQCHQAGRAEVEAKYAALVAAVEGLVAEWDAAAATLAPEDDWGDSIEATIRADFLREKAAAIRAVLDDPADPAEGGDRG